MAVYCCSDLHGMLKFYDAVKEFIKPEDKVYFLGDAGDRGPQPWETIKKVLTDPQFIYLKGNHEDMLVKALEDTMSNDYVTYTNARLLYSNGGDQTYNEAINEDRLDMWVRELRKLPLIQEYVNTQGQKIVLSHAGFTPWLNDDETSYRIPSNKDLIWNRDHFFESWNADECADVYIVHGHTPIPYLSEDIDPHKEEIEMGAFWYDNGRKCCVDCGAFFTGVFTLLNLDTWEQEVFQSGAFEQF